jgi:hypothetical protein
LGTDERLAPSERRRFLKQSFSTLIDSMKDAQHMGEAQERTREIEETNKGALSALEKLQEELTKTVFSFQDAIGKEWTEYLEKQVSSLSLIALDLTRKKIQEKYTAELKETQEALEIEKTKTFKSLEAFLAIPPFSVIERSITVKLLGGVYSAVASYNCADDIQFEFSLDCNKSTVLNKEFRISSSEGETKIPISLGKRLLKKEPVAVYEGLDEYVLSTVLMTETSITAMYVNNEKSSTVKITDSKRDSHASLTIEYSNSDGKVSVTSEPALSKFLDSEQVERFSDSLWQTVLELEKYKITLLKLISDGNVVFDGDRLDPKQFLAKAWKIIEPDIVASIRDGPPTSEGAVLSSDEGVLDQAFVRQRIGFLGKSGSELLEALKLS